jgi:ATP-binding dynein motor region
VLCASSQMCCVICYCVGKIGTQAKIPCCSALLKKQEAMKVELSDLNKALLTTLANASGNILENKELLGTLDRTKAAAVDTAAALAESARLQADLDGKRNAYLPAAQQAATVYFALADLRALSHVYRISLEAFRGLFRRALGASARSADIALRTAAIQAVRAQI